MFHPESHQRTDASGSDPAVPIPASQEPVALLSLLGQLGRSQKSERAAISRLLRSQGKTWVEIAELFRARYRVNARIAMRYAHCWSQAQVASKWCDRWPDDLETGKNISYWELWPAATGHAPSFVTLSQLAEIYECSVVDLLADLPDYRHRDDASRAPLNMSTGAKKELATSARFGADAGLASDLTDSTRIMALQLTGSGRRGVIDPDSVAGFGEISHLYRRSYHSVPASQLLEAAVAHLRLVLSMSPADQPRRERQSLITTAGEMATLAGVLYGLDAGHRKDSLSYLDLAWAAARMVSDTDLQAVTLGCRSFVLAYGNEGDHSTGLECADFAFEVAMLGASSETRAWVAAVASERAASVGDVPGCQRRMDDSRVALEQSDGFVKWRGIGGFNDAKLRAYEGGNMVRLGRHSDALVVLDDAICRLDETMQRHRATALIDRAEARASAGEPDGALVDAEEALSLVAEVQHAGNLTRIDNIVRRGSEAGMPAARRLYNEIQFTRADFDFTAPG